MSRASVMDNGMGLVRMRRRREPWGRFLWKLAVVFLLIAGFWHWFMAHYTVHIDPQANPSMGARIWLVSHQAGYRPEPGAIAAFRARDAGPYFDDGVMMAKRVVAGPGDWVGRLGDAVVHARPGEPGRVLAHLHHPSRVEPGVVNLPEGAWWVLGATESSWDSRYWGAVELDQWVGPAYPIF